MKITGIKSALTFALVFSTVFSVFAAKDKKNVKEVPAASAVPVEISKNEGKSQKASEVVENKKNSKKPAEQPYQEQVFSTKSFTKICGDIKLSIKGATGAYNIAVLDEENSAISLTETYDEYTSTFFGVLIGSKEYKLSNRTGIVVGARPTKYGAQILYAVQKLGRVLVDFTCLKSDPEKPEDVVRVDVTVENSGKRTNQFGIKTVIDTILGEKFSAHFMGPAGKISNGEVQYKSFDDMKYIISKNNKASMEILYTGMDTTLPDSVSLANKDVFALPGWNPAISIGRPFDSVFSYNNSAVEIIWPAEKLKHGEKRHIVYYIFTATGENPLGAEKFEKNYEELKKTKSLGEEYNYPTDALSWEGKKEEPVTGGLEEKDEVKAEPENKYDAAYVQKLIDRIEALDPKAEVDQAELQKLNQEIDSIMEVLRK